MKVHLIKANKSNIWGSTLKIHFRDANLDQQWIPNMCGGGVPKNRFFVYVNSPLVKILTSCTSISWTKKASPLSPSFMCRSTGSPFISMSIWGNSRSKSHHKRIFTKPKTIRHSLSQSTLWLLDTLFHCITIYSALCTGVARPILWLFIYTAEFQIKRGLRENRAESPLSFPWYLRLDRAWHLWWQGTQFLREQF